MAVDELREVWWGQWPLNLTEWSVSGEEGERVRGIAVVNISETTALAGLWQQLLGQQLPAALWSRGIGVT